MMMGIDLQRYSTAERLLMAHGVTHPDHIDLDAIAFLNGAEVIYRRLEGCEARLVANDDRAVISISSESNDGRQRFSLAHELAHWICDRNTGSFLCAKEDIDPKSIEAKSVESRANEFASQLILPTYLVDPWMQGKPLSLDLASNLRDDFNSSLTAAAIKLIKRTTASACLVCHDQTRLVWHMRSCSFSSNIFLLRELHQDTHAFRLAFGGPASMARPKRESSAYWMFGREVAQSEVTTQSVRLPNGNVLTMIVFV